MSKREPITCSRSAAVPPGLELHSNNLNSNAPTMRRPQRSPGCQYKPLRRESSSLFGLCLALLVGSTALADIQKSADAPPRRDDLFGKPTTSGRIVGDLVGTRGRSSGGFFERGSATSVFDRPATLNDAPQVHILNAHLPRKQEEEMAEETPVPEEKEQEKSLKDKLTEQYGNPDEEPVIAAQADAPKPFKGLMEALQAGDDDLAYKYARQYARYQNNLQERILKVTNMIEYGMKSEKYIPGPDEEDDDVYGIRPLYEKDLKEREREDLKKTSEQAKTLVKTLDPSVQALLDRAAQDEQGEVEGSRLSGAKAEIKKPVEEKSERALARQKHGGQVIDQNGRVKVYYFFRLADSNAEQMTQHLQELHNSYMNTSGVQVIGMSLDTTTDAQLQIFGSKRKVTYPLKMGGEFAKKIGVTQSPTVVVVAASAGKAIVEEGERSFFYLDEMVKLVRGSKR